MFLLADENSKVTVFTNKNTPTMLCSVIKNARKLVILDSKLERRVERNTSYRLVFFSTPSSALYNVLPKCLSC